MLGQRRPLDEVNETFFVNLTSPTNATIADAQGVGTIIDDDAPPDALDQRRDGHRGQQRAPSTRTSPSRSRRRAARRSASTTRPPTARATAGADYTATSGKLIFNPGPATRTLTVQVTSDTLDELDETFFVEPRRPGNATIADGQGVGTITDDDNAADVRSATPRSPRATPGPRTRSSPSRSPPRAAGRSRSTTRPRTARRSRRPTTPRRAATLRSHPGQTTRRSPCSSTATRSTSSNETFLVNLSNADERDDRRRRRASARSPTTTRSRPCRSATRPSPRATRAPRPRRSRSRSTRPSGRALSVDYATADGSAIAPADYTRGERHAHLRGRRDDEDGQRPRQRRHARRDRRDVHPQPLERGQRDHRRTARALGTITDNDPLPALAINDVTVTEGDSGTVAATFTVSTERRRAAARSRSTTRRLTARRPRRATTPSTSGTLTFAAGQTTKDVTVIVNGDVHGRARRDLHGQRSRRPSTPRLPTARASARSPTTTASRRSRSTT